MTCGEDKDGYSRGVTAELEPCFFRVMSADSGCSRYFCFKGG
jgi:hypothetical protein